jgi:hypothetical protein
MGHKEILLKETIMFLMAMTIQLKATKIDFRAI